MQTIYTPAAQIGFSSQFKCVLLYTFYGEIMIPEYVEKRKIKEYFLSYDSEEPFLSASVHRRNE